MHIFGTFCFWMLSACILWQGSLAEDQSGFVCLIDKPNPNHCENFYLTQLQSLLNKVERGQHRNTQLNSLVDQQGKLKGQLQEMQSKLEEQLKGVEAKLDGQLKAVQTKFEESHATLEENQQTVLTKMENSQAKLEGSLLAVQAKLDTQLQAVLNRLQALIGSRYFRIINEWAKWETAEKRCREMRGYLASFRNEEEFNAIYPKLTDWPGYWLGINDRDKEGHFVSVASQKPAPFLKWAEGHPDVTNHEQNCVYLYNGEMSDIDCKTYAVYFICQADNET
ncbi:hypothetical protein KR059_003407 [Drosophila kikkawai]|nr:hypothetical protein KR059_003407 [Drosophila kikkawai]